MRSSTDLRTAEPESKVARRRESDRLLSVEQVAEITGLSVETLNQWRSQRRGLPFVKLGRNRIRYRQSDLDAFIEANIIPVHSSPRRR